MSFNLETTEMDLGNTPIDNIFLNDYMPMANGTYVKVYLLGYKYAHDKDSHIALTNRTLAKHLDIPLDDVLSAWDFWESKGIVEKSQDDEINYKVTFLNLKQLYIKNNFSSKKNEGTKQNKGVDKAQKELIEANQIPEINNMFNQIDYIMRRQTTPVEKSQILGWIKDYNMNPDVLEKAFDYGVEQKKKRSINYVEGIVRRWYDKGLTNMEAVIENFKETDERYYSYQRIYKSLGLSRKELVEGDIILMNKWFDEYGFNLEMILKACELGSKVQYPSISYIDAILKSWFDKGINSIEDINVLDKKEKPKKETASKRVYKTKFHNFKQRTDEYTEKDLEDIAKKKREEHKRKMGEK